MTELEFRNTNPTDYGSGNINLLYSSSISTGSFELPANHYGVSQSFDYDYEEFDTNGNKVYYKAEAFFPPYSILGLTIPFNSSNDVELEQTLSAVTKVKFTMGGSPVTVKVIQVAKNAGYFFIRTEPNSVMFFPTEEDTSGTPTDSVVEFIFDPYLAAKFNNNDFNALIGNASDNILSEVAMQVDRSTDPINPSNLDAIISNTATRASIQYSNYTVAGWSNARYNGSIINSGSIFGDDPAMAFKSFKGSIHPKDADVATILTVVGDGDTSTKPVYFNVDRKPTDYVQPGSTFITASSFPVPVSAGFIGNLLYEQQGNRFVRIVDKKIHASDKGSVFTVDELGRVVKEESQ